MGKTVTTECATYAPGKTRNPHNPRAHAGRLVERLGGRGRRRHGAARARQPDQRLGDPPGRLLRRLRLQADARPDPAPRHPASCRARSTTSACSRARSRTSRCLRAARRAATSAIPTRGRARASRSARSRRRSRRCRRCSPSSRPPVWERADEETREAFDELVAGARRSRRARSSCRRHGARRSDWHRTIMEAEMAANLDREYEQGPRPAERVAARAARARPRRAPRSTTSDALARIPLLNEGFDEIFERCDAIVTPAAAGTAPQGPRIHRRSVVLHALDAVRHAGAHAAADAGRERPAARRAAGRPRATAMRGCCAPRAGWSRRIGGMRPTEETRDASQDLCRHRRRRR